MQLIQTDYDRATSHDRYAKIETEVKREAASLRAIKKAL